MEFYEYGGMEKDKDLDDIIFEEEYSTMSSDR